MRRKKAFTLLEIIISIAILSLIASTLSVGALRLINYHRYKNEVAEIVYLFEKAKEISKTLDQCFTISVTNEVHNKKKFVEIRVVEPHNKHLAICHFHKRLEGIEQVFSSYEHKTLFNKKISFFPSGEIIPEESLYFYQSRLNNLEGIKIVEGKVVRFSFSNTK